MKLKEIVETLYEDSSRTPARGLSAIAEAERYLQQAYEGRYFFELIQNVRDANKEVEEDGEVLIQLDHGVLSISNTGAEFSERGIESITTIGISTKSSQDYIGFKGIGFKSIREITDIPKITTKYGTVLFDRRLTLSKLNNGLSLEQVPLFFFPHYELQRLSAEDERSAIVTRIDLPLKEQISEESVFRDFSQIQAKQLILLGNIRLLEFRSDANTISYEIEKDARKHSVQVRRNDGEVHRFRVYSPSTPIEIPESVIETLEGKEKDIFSKSPKVDITVVVEMNDNGQVTPIQDAELYLFYPLKFSSGFRFLIHSYFVVNPERTALRTSNFNSFLLKSIGTYIGSELLKTLRSARINTTKILCFKRNPDAKLNDLYDSVVKELRRERFIYDTYRKKYFSLEEVIIADGFDKGLFPEGRLKDRHLVYVEDAEVRDWLLHEFSAQYLSFQTIRDEIEAECQRQAKRKAIGFFQNLYNYVSKYEDLNLVGKKVLLTEDWKLVSSEEDVFYGGGKRTVQLAPSIRKQIRFIHRAITISDFRDGRSRTGIIEFNTYELVRRLLKLFENENIPKKDILNAIFNLELDAKSEQELKERIRLPVKSLRGRTKWLSPIRDPIYFETTHLVETFPDGNFVEQDLLLTKNETTGLRRKRDFLVTCGVWEVPAIYIPSASTSISPPDPRVSLIRGISNLTETPFSLSNDRKLHKPQKYSPWFTEAIIQNWETYSSFIESNSLPRMQFSNSRSYAKSLPPNSTLQASDFLTTLRTQKWVSLGDKDVTYSIKEVVGIEPGDFHQPHLQVVKKFLKLLPISYAASRKLIKLTGLIHLNSDSLDSLIALLRSVKAAFENPQTAQKDFVDFYNRILLTKLFDFYNQYSLPEWQISQLRNEYFLARNETTSELFWTKASDIYYIDDKPSYDLLPSEVKSQLQPQFTKRDKHTFGRLAARIGRRFSQSVRRELVESTVLRSLRLTEFIVNLAECLAVFEASLEIALSNQLELLKNVRVLLTENVRIKLTVGSAAPIEVDSDHYVDEHFNLHVRSHPTENRNRLISAAIAEILVKVLERDVQKASSDVLRFLNAPDKIEYLRDYEISEDRIAEIRAQLVSSFFSKEQSFFNALLLTRDLVLDDSMLDGASVNVERISSKFNGLNPEALEAFKRDFSFEDFSDPQNIEALLALLNLTGSSLGKLNQYLLPGISFDEHYKRQFHQLKNRYETRFEGLLFQHLSKQGIAQQELFQYHLDLYRNLGLTLPPNVIVFDVEDRFTSSVKDAFPFFPIEEFKEQSQLFDSFSSSEIYVKELEKLEKKLLPKTYFSQERLEEFLANNRRRSLLYFGRTKHLQGLFDSLFKPTSGEPNHTPTSNENALTKLIAAVAKASNRQIETVQPDDISSVERSTRQTPNPTGRRFDGAANDSRNKLAGIFAEMLVYSELVSTYKDVRWVSKNASKVPATTAGYNPEGDDILGYDIEYLDADANKHFVEVKGKSNDVEAFEISRRELEKAMEGKEFYHVIFITDLFDDSNRRVRDLGNIFLLDAGADFFSNDRFSVIYKSLEIRFRQNQP